jgi:hypothetical protein
MTTDNKAVDAELNGQMKLLQVSFTSEIRSLADKLFPRIKAIEAHQKGIREHLKEINGRQADEKHQFIDGSNKKNHKKVVIVKQVAGQGAMYDNLILPNEPSGFAGGKSIIDLQNMPIVLSPNEYRDGALRALT